MVNPQNFYQYRCLKLDFYAHVYEHKEGKGAMPKLFVGNLPEASTTLELRYWVEARGFRVESAEVVYDRQTGTSRGFGYVTLGANASIYTAISVLNGQRLDGRVLTVKEAPPLFARPEHFSAEGKPMPPKDRT